MEDRRDIPVVLTIAGSDSGGGAGIQADLKTFQALRVFGTSAITCLTAQNPDAVTGITPIAPDMVALQIRTVCDGFPIAAAKTGMLYSAEIVRAVAEVVKERAIAPLVVDPVMVSTSGSRLLREDAIDALCGSLFPLAMVVTPNLPEAEILSGLTIRTEADLRAAAKAIAERHGVACVAKGGHLEGGQVADILYERGKFHAYSLNRVAARETHGTGCTFSAALAAMLARGETLDQAVGSAKRFVTAALTQARPAGRHAPLNFTPDA